MRSFTSVSDRPLLNTRRAIVALIAGCALISLGIEAVMRVGFDRVSRIQHRMAVEYRAAIDEPRDPSIHRVLFVGNSLLDEGVDFDRVRASLSPDWDARRLVVEQTVYFDWYYGLRRLFREGARPDVVVLMMTPGHWVRPDSRGDYSAQYLVSPGDALAAARDLHLNPTQTASFLLASVSRFWGARAEVRNWLLGRFMPDLGRLMNYSSVVDTTPKSEETMKLLAAPRLERVRRLAEQYNVRLIALVPPIGDPQDGTVGLAEAGREAGVPVFAPVRSGSYPMSWYRDAGFHLNQVGAARFTSELISRLPHVLSDTASVRSVRATTDDVQAR